MFELLTHLHHVHQVHVTIQKLSIMFKCTVLDEFTQFSCLHSVTVSDDVTIEVPSQGFNVYGALSTASEFPRSEIYYIRY